MSTNKNLSVAFLWHMHQPLYKDPLDDKYLMPWVRLHGIKDYYPMAALVDSFDKIRVTFNLVPSLVEQINDYVLNDASDTCLDITLKKAGSLSSDDKAYMLKNFFKVNFKQFIEPNPRYAELYVKKETALGAGANLARAVKAFSKRDLLDLQVLFNMAWFHSISIDDDTHLNDLIRKGKDYTEGDKEYIVLKQKEIMSQILPLYRRLRDESRIEITTTPFYHPILPLIIDSSVAKISMPDSPMPKRFSHPEDASWQMEEAIKYHEEEFGARPRGVWPSEGSVSDRTLDLLIEKGIEWVATDEDILFNSLSEHSARSKGKPTFDRHILYRPYSYRSDRGSIAVIFRDKNISDTIGFGYSTWRQEEAAWDLINNLNNIGRYTHKDAERGILSIVMDGENAWEYFDDNGRAFFETLYSNLDEQEFIGSSTISGFLDAGTKKHPIKTVFPGSWINHNFDMWIGHEQDNLAWEYLAKVRSDLERFTEEAHGDPDSDGASIVAAWRELYIAEGSDWNWWYTGKAHSGNENPFDKIYRNHLSSIYRILGKPVPGFLKISIA